MVGTESVSWWQILSLPTLRHCCGSVIHTGLFAGAAQRIPVQCGGMVPRLTSAAAALLRQQRGVIARWQGESVGLGTRAMARACGAGGGWQSLGPRTYLASSVVPSAAQWRVAACLEAGRVGVLSGAAGLVEHGWKGESNRPVDVVVRPGWRRAGSTVPIWVRLHQSSVTSTRLAAVPVVSPSRAAVDAVAWARSDREAAFILLSALQQRVLRTDLVERELRRRRVRRATLLREVVGDFRVGSHTLSERTFARLCRREALPTPTRQVVRRLKGRSVVTDAEFESRDGRTVIVEIDGAHHAELGEWIADNARHNKLAARGLILLRVTALELRYDPQPFLKTLRSVLMGGVEPGDTRSGRTTLQHPNDQYRN